MKEISQKYQEYLALFIRKSALQSSEVHAEFARNHAKASLVTVKRALAEMVRLKLLKASGAGRSTRYEIAVCGRLWCEVDARAYCAEEPDRRYGLTSYNFELFPSLPDDIFFDADVARLEAATGGYARRTAAVSETAARKELERLVIELSWKSSKIEGNTYTLLDTEKLILEQKEARGHSRAEAQMILNHKEAFTFVHAHRTSFRTLTRANMEQVHALLVKDMKTGTGLRASPVGVTGSRYRPLDNVHQIRDAVDALSSAVARASTPYAKACAALLGMSYIQPFEDGNKRTSRMAANALLLAHGCTPLSYRSVDEHEYREAMMVFYELNSLLPFKKIFIGQYEFAAHQYAVR